MKRKMKAVAALSLAAVMLLAGCGSSKGTQDGGSTTAADTAEQQEGTETAASDSGEKIVIRVVGPIRKHAGNSSNGWQQIRTLQTGAGKAVRSRITRRLLNGYQLKIFLLRMYSSIHWQLHPITSLFLQVSMMMHSLLCLMLQKPQDIWDPDWQFPCLVQYRL